MKKLMVLVAMLFALISTEAMARTHGSHHHHRHSAHGHHHAHRYVHHGKHVVHIKKTGNTQVAAIITDSGVTFDDVNDKAFFFSHDTTVRQIQENGRKKIQDVVRQNYASGKNLVKMASQYIGENARQLGLPRSLWCADFMNMLVGGTDRKAASYLHRGSPASYGCTDCVAVTTRRGGNHVGIVTGYDERGNPIMISGNHNNRVGVGVYAKWKVIGYRYI